MPTALCPPVIITPHRSMRNVPCSGWTPKSGGAVQPRRMTSAPKRSMKSVQASWMFANAVAPRYQHGGEVGGNALKAFRHSAASGGSESGARFGKEHHGCRLMAGPTA